MKTQAELQQIFDKLTEDEKNMISFGLFPISILPLKLDNHDYAGLIGISQAKTGVVY